MKNAHTLDLVMVRIHHHTALCFMLCEWFDVCVCVCAFKIFNYVFSYYVQDIRTSCEREITLAFAVLLLLLLLFFLLFFC